MSDIIRRLDNSDKEMLQEFFDVMGEKSTSFFNVNHGNEKRCMSFFEDGKKDHIFWVIESEEDGRKVISGLAFIWHLDSTIPWFGIAIRDSFQGKHLGSKLLNFVSDYVEENHGGGILLRTAVTNTGAQHLYEKCGFERMGTHPSGEYLYLKSFKIGE